MSRPKPNTNGGVFAEAYITVKETVGSKIYSLELDEIRKPSSPDKGGLDNQANTPALDGYNKLLQKIAKARELLKNNPENPSPVKRPRPGGKSGVRFAMGGENTDENGVVRSDTEGAAQTGEEKKSGTEGAATAGEEKTSGTF